MQYLGVFVQNLFGTPRLASNLEAPPNFFRPRSVHVTPVTMVCWLYSGLVSSEDRHLGRKRSSADLGTNYPGDLLSLAQPKPRPVPPLLKRNTIGDFASTRAYQQASTASLVSTSLAGAFDQGLYNVGKETPEQWTGVARAQIHRRS